MDLVRLQWSWIPDYISSPSTVSPSREAGWQLWELPYIGINCSRWATSLKKNQSSTIFCLTGIMWQKSAQREVEQNTWLLINWLSGSLDRQPQTSKVPRTISPQAANLQNNAQTPWNLRQIGSWFWLWVLYGIVTKTWQVHSSPILVFEEKMFGSSALCRSPE